MQPFRRCDYNTFLGSWPFRGLGPRGSVEALLKEMRACLVDTAYVSPVASLFEHDPYLGGRWLISHLEAHPSLIPAPIANPTLTHSVAAWKKLVEQSHGTLDTVRLVPAISGFSLQDSSVAAFVCVAGIRRVLVTLRMNDARQGHPTCSLNEEPLANAIALAAKLPEVDVIINGARTAEVKRRIMELREQPNVCIDVTFVDGDQSIEQLAEQLSPDRLVMGSGYPIHYIHAATLKFKLAEAGFNNAK